MYLSIDSTVELIQKSAAALIIISLFVYGGWGLILRVILNPLKIKITSRTLKKLDDYLLDLQLLKLHHGINVTTKTDAELVFQAISQGILCRGDFKLLGFAPPIGLKKSNIADIWLSGMITIASLCIAVGAGLSLHESKYNHATYSQGSEKVLISELDIYDIKSHQYILKTDCKKIDDKSRKILSEACSYLLNDDKDKTEELTWAINRNNKAIVSLFTIIVLLVIISLLASILSIQHYQINNKFYEFKFER